MVRVVTPGGTAGISEGGIESDPPGGKKKVTGIWWDPDTEEVVLIIKD